jgi:hypothetical protein
MSERLTAWQVVLQSQAIHPTWRASEHGNFLMDEGYDVSVLGRKAGEAPGLDHDETPIECIARWLRENEAWPGGAAARAGVDSLCDHGSVRCVACINAEVRKAVFDAEARFEKWKAEFTEAAHEAADSAGLCSDFDRFMERNGLYGRTRSYEVEVRVTMDVTVTVEARNDDHAEQTLGLYEIRNAVTELIQSEGSSAVANFEIQGVEPADD